MLEVAGFDGINALAAAAAAFMLEKIAAEKFRASVILSGGTTPRAVHERLAVLLKDGGIDASRIRWYFGDERWVSDLHPQSNERMARETLLARIGAAEENIRGWHVVTGSRPEAVARVYEDGLARDFAGKNAGPDLVILGLGADGHTASLFPDASALDDDGRKAISRDMPGQARAVFVPSQGMYRLTLTPAFLSRAKHVLFLVSGAEKKPALRRLLEGDPSAPASWIDAGSMRVFATRDAL